MHIDDTWEKCYGYTEGMKENEGYAIGSSKKRGENTEKERQAKQKELLEEYLEKRAQTKRLQEKLLNEEAEQNRMKKNRPLHSENPKRQMAQASAFYETNGYFGM